MEISHEIPDSQLQLKDKSNDKRSPHSKLFTVVPLAWVCALQLTRPCDLPSSTSGDLVHLLHCFLSYGGEESYFLLMPFLSFLFKKKGWGRAIKGIARKPGVSEEMGVGIFLYGN